MLSRGMYAAGTHLVDWDGRDAAGRIMPAGTYLVRLTAGTLLESQKVILIK
jgi:hypothetical protein